MQGTGEEDEEEIALKYARTYGDDVSYLKTNTFKLSEFSNNTAHGRLVNTEVANARAYLSELTKEKKLLSKFAYCKRDEVIARVTQSITFPESERFIAFRVAQLGKGKVEVRTASSYPIPTKSTGKQKASAVPRAEECTYKQVELTITREELNQWVNLYSSIHEANPPIEPTTGEPTPPLFEFDASTDEGKKDSPPSPLPRPSHLLLSTPPFTSHPSSSHVSDQRQDGLGGDDDLSA